MHRLDLMPSSAAQSKVGIFESTSAGKKTDALETRTAKDLELATSGYSFAINLQTLGVSVGANSFLEHGNMFDDHEASSSYEA
ncbi:hypothetical protein MMC27_004193 [Xylographa pallens]|nr:hypothetical protein [Xylographa pallens]